MLVLLLVEVLAAAFGRLCVETLSAMDKYGNPLQPPSGGCVLKPSGNDRTIRKRSQPTSGGCVLKLKVLNKV